MHEAASFPFVAWESFYVIVGSSAAALTGLQFVVMALIADSETRSTTREVDAFGTPTVVHFCAVLLVSAILSAPWHGYSGAATALTVCGLSGMVYGVIVVRRALRQSAYKPVMEDWLWHAVLPLLAYSVLRLSALSLGRYPTPALFAIGATALLLLFIGIHNAWDTVTYIAVGRRAPNESRQQQ
jgi:hypothetical protein